MRTEDMEDLLADGREKYRALLNEAADLLKNLDSYSTVAFEAALQRRQQLVEELQSVDDKLSATADIDRCGLEEYQVFQKEITAKILELDGLVIAFTRQKQSDIKLKMSGMTKSLSATQAYEKGASSVSEGWNELA